MPGALLEFNSPICAVVQAITIPGGFDALAEVANEMIVQTSCSNLAPLTGSVQAVPHNPKPKQCSTCPSAESALHLMMNPQLVSCIVSSIA